MTDVKQAIVSLKRGPSQYGPAPHKPVLLLAIIKLFEKGTLTHNWIEPSKELVATFNDVWYSLVKTNHTPTFALPFYHLKNEKSGIWDLIIYSGKTLQLTASKSIKSYFSLVNTVAAASLSQELYAAISKPNEREVLKLLILQKYFPHATKNSLNSVTYTDKVKNEILYEPSENYVRMAKKKIDELPTEMKEQEVAIRSHIFRKAILDIYNNSCSISGLKVSFQDKPGLIDACHISPFAESFDDTIRNGIALSPNLHRAFDRGMIAISDDYTVLLHKNIKDHSTGYGIKQFENKNILLPSNAEYYPDTLRLKEHRAKFGF